MRVAVLGAGAAGVCTALEIARRGFSVDLYDENPEAITRASLHNEGKIHLGLVYAKDRTLKSAKAMILGAIHFLDHLARWIDPDAIESGLSDPYYYAVHRRTMAQPAELEQHYAQCAKLLADAVSATGLAYLGRDRSLQVKKVARPMHESVVAPDQFLCSYLTSERAIDPRLVADQLRIAVAASPRIRFIASARVNGAAWVDSDRLAISFEREGAEYTERYDQVVNALWNGRLEIDAALGLAPERGWVHRYKLGGWIDLPVQPGTVPTLTMVLGPFGDVVNFGQRGLYFSWYPTGLVGSSSDITPPAWNSVLTPAGQLAIVQESYARLREQCPALPALQLTGRVVQPAGGFIFAWGASGIEDAGSRLHTRYEIGVHSLRTYHSINTGKYTMAPYLGVKTAERILGPESR